MSIDTTTTTITPVEGHLDTTASELAEVIRDVPVVIQETKEGYKTTEFWAGLVTVLIPLLAGAPEKLMVPLTGAIGVAYIISRGIAKRGVPAAVTPVEPTAPAA